MQVRSEREVVQVGDALVTVRKSALDLGRENIVGIKLAISSAADQPVAVQVTEEFPGHVSMSDVQVHPQYDPGKWSISEQLHRMEFSDELAPGAEVETIYGVRVTDGNLEPFLGEPRLAVSDGAADGRTGDTLDDVIPREAELSPAEGDEGAEASQASAPATGAATHEAAPSPATDAQRGSAAAADATQAGGDAPDGEPESLEELFQYGEARDGSGAAQGSEPPRPAVGGSSDTTSRGDRVQAIAQELAGRQLTDQQRSTLRAALDLGPDRSQAPGLESAVARLESLVQRLERALAEGAPRTPAADHQPAATRPSAGGVYAPVSDPSADRAAGSTPDDSPREERAGDDEQDEPPSRLALLDPEAAKRRGDGGTDGGRTGSAGAGAGSNGKGAAASGGAADASADGGRGDAGTQETSDEDADNLQSLFADSGR